MYCIGKVRRGLAYLPEQGNKCAFASAHEALQARTISLNPPPFNANHAKYWRNVFNMLFSEYTQKSTTLRPRKAATNFGCSTKNCRCQDPRAKLEVYRRAPPLSSDSRNFSTALAKRNQSHHLHPKTEVQHTMKVTIATSC